MPETKRRGPGLDARMRGWESVLVMVFLMDLFEDRVLFQTPQIPPWCRVAGKMALVVGVLGILLSFINRRIDRGVSTAHSLTGRSVLPKLAVHVLLFGSVFVGYFWLKIGRLPWQ